MYPMQLTTPIAKTIDPRVAIAPSRLCEWRWNNANVASNSTATVLGATLEKSAILRFAEIRVSTLGPAPNALSATNATIIDMVTMANTDVTRGNHRPTPINARPHAANPSAAAGGVETLAGNSWVSGAQ